MTVDSNFWQVLQAEGNTRKRVYQQMMKVPFIFYDMKIMIAFNREEGKLIYLSDSELWCWKKGLNARVRDQEG